MDREVVPSSPLFFSQISLFLSVQRMQNSNKHFNNRSVSEFPECPSCLKQNILCLQISMHVEAQYHYNASQLIQLLSNLMKKVQNDE